MNINFNTPSASLDLPPEVRMLALRDHLHAAEAHLEFASRECEKRRDEIAFFEATRLHWSDRYETIQREMSALQAIVLLEQS